MKTINKNIGNYNSVGPDFNTKYWKLKQFDLISKLSKDEFDCMAQAIEHRHFKKGQDFLIKGRKRFASNIYFIKNGAVKVTCYLKNGAEVIKNLYNEGEILGILNLFENDGREDYITALDDTYVCILDVRIFKGLMDNNKSLNDYVFKLINKRVKKIESNFSFLVNKNATERIENFLFGYMQDFGEERDGFIYSKNMLSNKDIALITFTSRQTVNKVMNNLKRESIICFNRGELWMPKPGATSKK
ncbi:Crp/Fnr family transcriptional regulator [Flagellimonas sp. 2504JD4-2]